MGESAERIERIALCSNFIDRLPKDYFIEKGIYECFCPNGLLSESIQGDINS